jgi:SAM-dependent methyltransferase
MTFEDTRAELRSLAELHAFFAAHPHLLDMTHIEAIVAHGARAGLTSGFLGDIPPEKIEVRDTNYRETYLGYGFNARQRALLDELHALVGHRSIYDISIYAHEAMTPFALILRGRYPRFLGSEYAPHEADQKRIFPVPSIDITASGFRENSFDFILSGDVLEHVPDLYAALSDSARILKPGGHLIATMPFAYGHEQTTIKARIKDGEIEYLAPPEYHGNPMDAAGGSLVYQIPGWAILHDTRKAGFSDAHFLFWSSAQRGFAGDAGLGGIWLMVARK